MFWRCLEVKHWLKTGYYQYCYDNFKKDYFLYRSYF